MKTNCWLILGTMIATSAVAQSTNTLPPIPAPVTTPAAEMTPAPAAMPEAPAPEKKAPVKHHKKHVEKHAVAESKKAAFSEPTVTLQPGVAEVEPKNLNVRGQAGLKGEVYDLIVKTLPYVTDPAYAALTTNSSHEPELGLTAGADGLDFALRILDQAPKHLSPNGWLICEVGEAERALSALLPKLPLNWIEFAVGQMGVFAIAREDILKHAKAIKAALAKRK